MRQFFNGTNLSRVRGLVSGVGFCWSEFLQGRRASSGARKMFHLLFKMRYSVAQILNFLSPDCVGHPKPP